MKCTPSSWMAARRATRSDWPGPIPTKEHVVTIAQGVVQPRQNLLSFFREWEHPAVFFEERDDAGMVGWYQRRGELTHEWS